jgi:hypothetical protein
VPNPVPAVPTFKKRDISSARDGVGYDAVFKKSECSDTSNGNDVCGSSAVEEFTRFYISSSAHN